MQTPSSTQSLNATETVESPSSNSMEDYYRLQRQLLKTTIAFSAIIFGSVWLSYSLHVALNYLIGACTGVVYLRMLSKNVEQIGRGAGSSGGRLALVALLILVASQWNQLEIVPAFLGFLTYKAALIGYTIWAAVPSE